MRFLMCFNEDEPARAASNLQRVIAMPGVPKADT
jgi:hypothetical protein